mgnify:CR=1 FL=1
MAIRAGIAIIPLNNAPCVKCGHPDLLQVVMSIERIALGALGEDLTVSYRHECAACGHPIDGNLVVVAPVRGVSGIPICIPSKAWLEGGGGGKVQGKP